MSLTYLARQPIFDRDQVVYGYELLSRQGPENRILERDLDRASAKVIQDSLTAFDWTELLGERMAFVNVTQSVLVQRLIEVMPRGHTVVELLESVEPVAATLEACRALKRAGYLIALDDFVWRPQLEPLISLGDIVKVDFLTTQGAERARVLQLDGSGRIRFLAEKIETREDFEQALELGYTYFQGYFFCRPEMISTQQIPGFKLSTLRFLQEVYRAELDFRRLEEVIRQDLALSVKLLRFLNSAAFGLVRSVASIRQAITLLGERAMRRWAAVLALTGLGEDKPQELALTGLLRGRLCETIGAELGLDGSESDLFLLGMLSVVDALMDRPLGEILPQLPLVTEISAALLQRSPPLGPLFEVVLAYERGDWERALDGAERLGLSEPRLVELYWRAVAWAEGVLPV
jgi:EAL and modified HD-GYP domain-containing signal transduction protein